MEHTSARLRLRPPAEDDLARLFAIYGDAATNTFNPAGPLPDVGRAQALLAGCLAQWRECGLEKRLRHRTGLAALAFGFDEHRCDKIFGLVRPQHAASIRVLEKIGMARFATLDDVPGQAQPGLPGQAAETLMAGKA